MTTKKFPTVAIVFSLGLGLGACGGEKQMHAQTPPAAQPAPVASARTMQPSNSPTASTVKLSENVMRACNIPDGDAYFEFDSSRLTSFDNTPLNAVARCFSVGPLAGRRVDLVGHADPRGGSDYNMALGQSRADAVGTYLATHGVSRGNEESTSRGAMDATGHDETSWAHDRRVDVLLAN